jgi:hypothetical protein
MRAWLARLSFLWVWRSRVRTARLFRRFAHTELASHYDLMIAANAVHADAAMTARLLRHALDEQRHALLFQRYADQCTGHSLGPVVCPSDGLWQRFRAEEFFAFVFIGEARGLRQFRSIASVLHNRTDDAAKHCGKLLEAVMVDERRHAYGALRSLRGLAGSRARTLQELGRMRRIELWWQWRELGSAPTRLVYTALVSLLYVLATPLRWWMPHVTQRWTGT